MPSTDPLTLSLVQPGLEIEADVKVWRSDGVGRTLLGTIKQLVRAKIHAPAIVWKASRPSPERDEPEQTDFPAAQPAIDWIRTAPWADPTDPSAAIILISGTFHHIIERLPGGGLVCSPFKVIDNPWESPKPFPIVWRHGAGYIACMRRTPRSWVIDPAHGPARRYNRAAGAFAALGDLGLPPDASAHMRMQRRAQKLGLQHQTLAARFDAEGACGATASPDRSGHTVAV